MIVLSLFDGISGAQLALKRAGIKVDKYYASEVDKYAISITQKNFPETIQLGDITKWREWDIEKPDLIIGGSPCQGFSFAGKQLNFEDERSKLFFEYIGILHYYAPKYYLLENVKMKKEFQKVISERMLTEPIEINSALVSAQNRKRLYWCNWDVEQPEDKGIFWHALQENNANCFYYRDSSFNWIFKDKNRKEKFKVYTKETKGKMQMLEASHYKGYSNQRCFGIYDNGYLRYISPIECERLQTFPDNYTEGISNTQRYKALGNSFTVDVIAHILKNLDK